MRFDVTSDWILKLKIKQDFFNTLKNDLDSSKIAMQKVAGFLDVVGWDLRNWKKIIYLYRSKLLFVITTLVAADCK